MSLELHDRERDVKQACDSRDSQELFRLANLESKEGNDEYAEALQQLARRIDKEDWAYDEATDQAL